MPYYRADALTLLPAESVQTMGTIPNKVVQSLSPLSLSSSSAYTACVPMPIDKTSRANTTATIFVSSCFLDCSFVIILFSFLLFLSLCCDFSDWKMRKPNCEKYYYRLEPKNVHDLCLVINGHTKIRSRFFQNNSRKQEWILSLN